MPYEQLFHIYSVFILFVVFLLICDLEKLFTEFTDKQEVISKEFQR